MRLHNTDSDFSYHKLIIIVDTVSQALS
jgi:hypothetical protein